MNQKKTYTLTEAKRALERYCVYQDRCYKEVTHKLQQMGMIPLAIDEVLLHLAQHNFLDEERFAKSFARGKFNIKHWGRHRITRELKFRNISAYNIKTALKEFTADEYLTKLDYIAQRKLQFITEENTFKKRKKLTDYLLYRGWESTLVYDIAKQLIP